MVLTPRKKDILAFIEKSLRENGQPPSLREIGDAVGINASSVFTQLKSLVMMGYLKHVGPDIGTRAYVPVDASDRCPHCGRPYPKKS